MAVYEVRINGKILGSTWSHREGHQWGSRRAAMRVARTCAQTQWYLNCKDSSPCPGGVPLLVRLRLSNNFSWGVSITPLVPSRGSRLRRYLAMKLLGGIDRALSALPREKYPEPINR